MRSYIHEIFHIRITSKKKVWPLLCTLVCTLNTCIYCKLHPQISCTLNLAATILDKKLKKRKAIQSQGFRSLLNPLFIEHKLTINTEMENTSKPYPQF